jgi:branched-chain amino acid transport system permease protein
VGILQLVLNAVVLGAGYALVALGFVLVLNAVGAVNFAQGDLVLVGAYAAIMAASVINLPGILLLPVVVVVAGLIGLVLSGAAFFPLRNRPPVTVFISTIACGVVIQNTLNVAFGPEPRAGPALLGTSQLDILGLQVSSQSLAIVAVAALLVVGQHLLLNSTQFGRRLRATAQDREIARGIGIPVTWMIAASFALSAAFSGAGGLLLANQFFVSPNEGGHLMLKAYIAVTIGGWGSTLGAVVGALIVALFEVLVSSYVSYTAASVALYACVLVLLVVRPNGLFQESVQRRA